MIKSFKANGIVKTYSMYNGEIKVQFNETGHRYVINDTEVVGVTTILKTVIAKEALLNWAVKLCSEYVRTNIKPDTKYTLEQLTEIIDTAKKQHRLVKDASADIGVATHKIIEQWINADIVRNKYYEKNK